MTHTTSRVVLSAVVLLACAAAPAAAQTPTLTVKPISWDVIGLDSNNVTVGPNVFMVGARVSNTSATITATNVTATFVFDTANAFINLLDPSAVVNLGTLAPGARRDIYFNVEITRSAAAYNTLRQYHIEFTADNLPAPGVSTPIPRQLYVEKLVSQGRNSVISFNGPTTVFVGDTVTYTVISKTATQGYEQLEQTLTFLPSMFRVVAVQMSYSAPPGATNDTIYADASGWDPLARASVGPPNYTGGKAGGSMVSTYTLEVVGAGGPSTVSAVIYDFSGSSYHYNSDVGAGVNALVVTSQVPADGTVRLTASDGAAAESPLDEGTFTLTRVGPTTAPLTVNFAVSGSGARGVDYTLLDAGGALIAGTSVTIPAGASAATIRLVPADDAAEEGPETATLTITPDAAYTVGSPSVATVSIADDDAPTVTIATTTATCDEDVAAAPAVLTVTRSVAAASALTVSFAVSGTATQGTDYLLKNAGGTTLTTSVTIAANETQAVVNVVPSNDTLEEGDEVVQLTLAAGLYNLGAPGAAAATILDDEPIVSVVALTPTCVEDAPGAPAVFRISRRVAKAQTLTVEFTVGGTAVRTTDYDLTGNGFAFAAGVGEVVIPANATSTDVTVTPIDDAALEGPETVALVLAIGSPQKYGLGASSDASVTISDDEASTVTIAATQPAAAEPATSGTFVVTRTAPLTGALVVNVSFGGSATTTTDYTLAGVSGTSVTIADGQASATITLTPVDDTAQEGSETATLRLSLGAYNLGAADEATVTIADDDFPRLAFQDATSSLAEGVVTHTVVVQLTVPGGGALTQQVSVDVVDDASGTAGAGLDYTSPATQTRTFAIGSLNGATQTVSLALLSDNLVEGAETVVLRAQNATGGAAIGTQGTHAVTITDDDTATVAFTAATSSAGEGAGATSVTATLSITSTPVGGTLASAVTVQVVDATGGSATSGTDHTAIGTQTLTFAASSAGGATASASVTPTQDASVEGPETINLAAQNVTGQAALGAQTTHTFTITDDDTATVAFTAATSSAGEGAGATSVTATLSITSTPAGATLASAVTVQVVDATGGSATSGTDYTAIGTQTLTFAASSAGGTTASASVTPTQDASVEGPETINLAAQSVTGQATLGGQTTHTFTITDDDTATVAFTAATSSGGEGAGATSVTATLSISSTPAGGTLASAVTVQVVDATGGSATSGTDHTAIGTQTLTFAASSATGATANASVTPTQDALVEGPETINLAAQSVTGQATLGAQTTHTFTITDDDTATVAFSLATSSASEGASATDVTATLSITSTPAGATLASAVTVDVVDATGGSATSGTDYTAIGTQTLTFSASSADGAMAAATVTPLQDADGEGDETVSLAAQNVSGPATLGGQQAHTFTITDDDAASVAFTLASSAAPDEQALGRAVTVTLSSPGGPLTQVVTVDVVDGASGSATPGTDHQAVGTQTLTFPVGSLDGAMLAATVTVIQDARVEGGETVVLRLQSVTGQAVIAAQDEHTLTVTDDDTATLAFLQAASATGDETAVGRTVSMRLTIQSTPAGATLDQDVIVQVVDAGGGSATSGSDFGAIGTQSLTFAAGSADGETEDATVTVTADLLVEGDETVNLLAQTVTGAAALGAQDTHTLTIDDDDQATVAFDVASSATPDEAAAARTITVVLSVPAGSLPQDVTVQVVDAGTGTATSGTDHSAIGTQTLTFPAGAVDGATLTATVTIASDALVEGDETIALVLQNVTGPAGLALAAHALTITDDETATVAFTIASSATPDESAAARTATITLSTSPTTATLGRAVTLDVVDALGGSATSGVDFTALGTQTLTFGVGSANGAVRAATVNVLADTAAEGAETVELRLQNVGAPGAAGAQTLHTLTITDDDQAIIDLAVASFTATEDQPTAVILVRRTGNTSILASVTFTTTDDSADASDYTSVTGTVTFQPGEVLATFLVPITDDDEDELRETVTITLSAPSPGAVLGPRVTGSLGIDDEPQVEIATTALPDGSLGARYEAPILLDDGGRGPTYRWTVVAGALPPGLSLVGDGPTVRLEGTPLASGPFTFTVRAIDQGQVGTVLDDQPFTLTIAPAGGAPEISDVAPPVATVGAPFRHALTGTGGQPPYGWTILSGSLPPGLSLDPATGEVIGVPTTPGTFTANVQVTDTSGASDPSPSPIIGETLIIDVIAAPVAITTLSVRDGSLNAPYDQGVSVVGGVGPTFTWTVSAGVPPPGLTLTGTGRDARLVGVPSATGTFTFTARAEDDGQPGVFDEQVYVVSIPPAGGPPLITTTSLPPSDRGEPYAAQVTAASGQGPYAWAVVGGALPPGIVLDPLTGALLGTPTQAGAWSITFRATDSLGQLALQTLTLVVAPPPVIPTTSLPPGRAGAPYVAVVDGVLGVPGYTFSITAGALPGGLTLDPATGVISGVPTGVPGTPLTIELVDAVGGRTTRALSIDLIAPAVVTVVTTSLPEGTTGEPYAASLAATGGVGPYTWTLATGTLPSGLTLDAASGTISGTPTAPSFDQLRFTATDTTPVPGTSVLLDLRVVDPVAITTPSLPDATVGSTYTAALTGAEGEGPYAWRPLGSLPPGLTLDALTGPLEGTLPGPASYPLVVEITDSRGRTSLQSYTITVSSPVTGTSPSLGGTFPGGLVGTSYSGTSTVTGGQGPFTFDVVSGSLPDGLALNTSDGRVTGTPTRVGSFSFTLEVSDSLGATDTAGFTVTISGGSAPGSLVNRVQGSGGYTLAPVVHVRPARDAWLLALLAAALVVTRGLLGRRGGRPDAV